MMKFKLNQFGLTIVELSIAVVMAGFIAIMLGGITIVFYGSILRSNFEARMVVDSQIILRNITDELRTSSGVRATNTLPDPYAPTGGWNTDSDNAILIIETPAVSSTNEFMIDSLTGEYHKNEIVYFADGDMMYRRVLIDTAAPENDRQQSCPTANVGTGDCTVTDSELSTDYDLMEFVFYDQDDAETLVVEDARSIYMTINLSRRAFKADVGIENNIRVSLRN